MSRPAPLLLLAFTLLLTASALPVRAQEILQFPDVHLITRPGGARIREDKGRLVFDHELREMRFERSRHESWTAPYDRITAIHYEAAKRPKQRFLNRPSYYVTVHYTDIDSKTAFATLRLVAEGDVRATLGALETETGLTVQRTISQQSFLGIPIRATIGDRVTLTDQAGQIHRGTIAQLSGTSLTLLEAPNVSRSFDDSSIHTIRLPYSARHDVLEGLAIGGFAGALCGAMIGAAFEGSTGALKGAALFGSVMGGITAGLEVAFGALRYPFDKSQNVYVRSPSGPSATPTVAVVPQVTKERKALLVSLRF